MILSNLVCPYCGKDSEAPVASLDIAGIDNMVIRTQCPQCNGDIVVDMKVEIKSFDILTLPQAQMRFGVEESEAVTPKNEIVKGEDEALTLSNEEADIVLKEMRN